MVKLTDSAGVDAGTVVIVPSPLVEEGTDADLKPTCRHHWLVAAPDDKTQKVVIGDVVYLAAVCKLCSEQTLFPANPDEYSYQDVRSKAKRADNRWMHEFLPEEEELL